MKAFIDNGAKAKVSEIDKQAQNDFNYGKSKLMEEGKTETVEAFEKKLEEAKRDIKIERSKALNQVRITKMRQVNEMVESLQHSAMVRLQEQLSNDQDRYAKLILDLLVQGLIKMIEPSVILRVR